MILASWWRLSNLLLLALVGVTPDEVFAYYELSFALRPDPYREELLARAHFTSRDVIQTVLAELNIESYLRMGGVSEEEMTAVRKRLLGKAVHLRKPWTGFRNVIY